MGGSVEQRLDTLWGEDSHPASAAAPPGQSAGAVQQVDDVTAQEVEPGALRGGVVAEGVSQAAPLGGQNRGIRSTGRHTSWWGRTTSAPHTPTLASRRRLGLSLSGWEGGERRPAEGRHSWELLLYGLGYGLCPGWAGRPGDGGGSLRYTGVSTAMLWLL